MPDSRLTIRRLCGGVLWAAALCGLALPLGAPALAQMGAATAPASPTVSYTITRHGGRVTLRDGAGRAVLDRRGATPTLRMVVAKSGRRTETTAPKLSVALQDANGLPLWSTLVPIPPQMNSMRFSVTWDDKTAGTQLSFLFASDTTAAPDSPDDDNSDAPPLVIRFGDRGQFLNANYSDGEIKRGPNGFTFKAADGTQADLKIKTSAHGVTVTGPDGSRVLLDLTDKGGTMEINGQTIPVTKTTRDGKEYLSFPWNGHNVLIETGCTFTISTDGTLVVNAARPAVK